MENNEGVISHYLAETIANNLNVEELLISVLEMIEEAANRRIHLLRIDDVYGVYINNEFFSEWLYNRNNPNLVDLKKELSIKIERAESIDEKCDVFFNRTDCFIISKYNGLFDNNVWSLDDYYGFRQEQLKQIDDVHLFAKYLPECFSNIFFYGDISNSLSTLVAPFFERKPEIIEHLKKLDEFYCEFQKMLSQGKDNKYICQQFKSYSGIDCSPQAGRDGVIELTKEFYNENTKRTESLKCELHTKLQRKGKQKPDRIYFHPGKKGIHNGKIIVIHIGEHK